MEFGRTLWYEHRKQGETMMMEKAVRELVGGEIKADEVERIVDRLTKIREALARLEPVVDSGVEPLPTVVMEDG